MSDNFKAILTFLGIGLLGYAGYIVSKPVLPKQVTAIVTPVEQAVVPEVVTKIVDEVVAPATVAVKRTARFVKGSPEAKSYMQELKARKGFIWKW